MSGNVNIILLSGGQAIKKTVPVACGAYLAGLIAGFAK
jgi:hypothetical protein